MSNENGKSFYDIMREELTKELSELFQLQGWYKPEVDLYELAKENANARIDSELAEGLAATKKHKRYFESKKENISKLKQALHDLMYDYASSHGAVIADHLIWSSVNKHKTEKEVETAIAELQKIM